MIVELYKYHQGLRRRVLQAGFTPGTVNAPRRDPLILNTARGQLCRGDRDSPALVAFTIAESTNS